MREFEFIESIRQLTAALPSNGFEGIGDDCATLPVGGGESLLFSADMLVEGVHFLRDTTSAYELGWKSLAVNLSDIAAMGATPIATLLSLSIPTEIGAEWAEEFIEGYNTLSQKYNVALVGGDTTSSKGQITINVTVIGRAKDSNIKRRRSAQVGDVIVVSSELGRSAQGLSEISRGVSSSPYASAHRTPSPRVDEGAWLGQQEGVHAMMDISDGVASDIRHIMSQSGVGARINLESIPTSVDTKTALCGGEDYELLFTLSPTEAEAIIAKFNKKFAIKISPIGEIIAGTDIKWYLNNKEEEVDFMGYRHF